MTETMLDLPEQRPLGQIYTRVLLPNLRMPTGLTKHAAVALHTRGTVLVDQDIHIRNRRRTQVEPESRGQSCMTRETRSHPHMSGEPREGRRLGGSRQKPIE